MIKQLRQLRDKGEIDTFVGIDEKGYDHEDAYRFGGIRAGYTIDFMVEQNLYPRKILDIGGNNGSYVGRIIADYYQAELFGTIGDLDIGTWTATDSDVDCIIMLEVLEHLLNPLWFLHCLKNKVPSGTDMILTWPSRPIPTDAHWHEFGLKRFKYLCDRAGYQIIRAEYSPMGSSLGFFKSALKGIRPFFRHFVDWHCIAHIKT